MIKKKLISTVALVLTMGALVVGCSNGGSDNEGNVENKAGEKVEITYGSTEQANMATGIASQWFTDEINTRSNGEIEVSFHPQGTLGTDADLTQQVMSGNIPMAGVSIGALSQYTPLLETVQLPFLLSDYEEEYEALQSDEMKALVADVESQFNIKILGFLENGMRHFATIDKPVNTIDDIKGVKLRVAPSVIIQEAMGLIGANPMSITYGEVSTALQNRTIDGEEINITSAGSQKHYEVIKYISEVGFYPYPSVYMVNGDFWNGLTEDQQKLLQDTFTEAMEKNMTELIQESEAKFRKECEDNGVIFNKVENIQAFKDAVQSLYQTYSDKDAKIAAFVDKFND